MSVAHESAMKVIHGSQHMSVGFPPIWRYWIGPDQPIPTNGDIILYTVAASTLFVSVWPNEERVSIGSKKQAVFSHDVCRSIVDIRKFVVELHKALPATAVLARTMQFYFEPGAAHTNDLLGFKVPPHWYRVRLDYSPERRSFLGVCFVFSPAPAQYVNCNLVPGQAAADILAKARQRFMELSAPKQQVFVIIDNYVVRQTTPRSDGLYVIDQIVRPVSDKKWTVTDRKLLDYGTVCFKMVGHASGTDEQLKFLDRAAKACGFVYKAKVAPVDFRIDWPEQKAVWTTKPQPTWQNTEPVLAETSQRKYNWRTVHGNLVDRALVFHSTLPAYVLLWILQWLPDYQWPEKRMIDVITATIASVRTVLANRDESGRSRRAVAHTRARKLSKIGEFEHSAPGASIVYGVPLVSAPFTLPANIALFEKNRDTIADRHKI